MADKAVSELIEAERITATDLFVLEQNGTAKKLTGQVLMNWLTAAADGHGGIQSIQKVSASGLVDTYRITLADTTTFDFMVTNGRGVNSITKTDTSGLVDTYTISYNDGTSGTFAVTNGEKGEKGDNQYVWIKYASQKPTASSHSFGDVADNWIGIYSGSSATAPTDWQQYTWFQIKGDKGDTGAAATLTGSKVDYQASDSGTIIPSGVWSESVPVVAQGRYLWTRTTNTFNTGSPVVAYSVSRMGLDGAGSVSSVANVPPDINGNVPLTAGDIGARPNTWMPTAADVGALGSQKVKFYLGEYPSLVDVIESMDSMSILSGYTWAPLSDYPTQEGGKWSIAIFNNDYVFTEINASWADINGQNARKWVGKYDRDAGNGIQWTELYSSSHKPTPNEIGAAPMDYSKKVGNPYNLLDNSDFRNPVMQGGLNTIYGGLNYPIDRWYDRFGFGNFTKTDKGITIAYGTNHAYFNQQIKNFEKLIGKHLTLAVCDYEGNVYLRSGIWNPVDTLFAFSINTTVEVTFAAEGFVQVVVIEGSIGLQWAALYEGEYTVETLPEYQPKGYEVELLNCGGYARTPSEYTATIPVTAWGDYGSAKFCMIAVDGMLATDSPIIDVLLTGTQESVESDLLLDEEWGKVYRVVVAAGGFHAYARETPTVDLPVKIKVVR